MPGMDGWETLERIRERSAVPVIMLTAHTEEPEILKGFALGADDYVAKPSASPSSRRGCARCSPAAREPRRRRRR